MNQSFFISTRPRSGEVLFFYPLTVVIPVLLAGTDLLG